MALKVENSAFKNHTMCYCDLFMWKSLAYFLPKLFSLWSVRLWQLLWSSVVLSLSERAQQHCIIFDQTDIEQEHGNKFFKAPFLFIITSSNLFFCQNHNHTLILTQSYKSIEMYLFMKSLFLANFIFFHSLQKK